MERIDMSVQWGIKFYVTKKKVQFNPTWESSQCHYRLSFHHQNPPGPDVFLVPSSSSFEEYPDFACQHVSYQPYHPINQFQYSFSSLVLTAWVSSEPPS